MENYYFFKSNYEKAYPTIFQLNVRIYYLSVLKYLNPTIFCFVK